MNGQVAKALRKQVYGERSHKIREYQTVYGARLNSGLRKRYLDLKKAYKINKRSGLMTKILRSQQDRKRNLETCAEETI